jgi:hypothetical protein
MEGTSLARKKISKIEVTPLDSQRAERSAISAPGKQLPPLDCALVVLAAGITLAAEAVVAEEQGAVRVVLFLGGKAPPLLAVALTADNTVELCHRLTATAADLKRLGPRQ